MYLKTRVSGYNINVSKQKVLTWNKHQLLNGTKQQHVIRLTNFQSSKHSEKR